MGKRGADDWRPLNAPHLARCPQPPCIVWHACLSVTHSNYICLVIRFLTSGFWKFRFRSCVFFIVYCTHTTANKRREPLEVLTKDYRVIPPGSQYCRRRFQSEIQYIAKFWWNIHISRWWWNMYICEPSNLSFKMAKDHIRSKLQRHITILAHWRTRLLSHLAHLSIHKEHKPLAYLL